MMTWFPQKKKNKKKIYIYICSDHFIQEQYSDTKS